MTKRHFINNPDLCAALSKWVAERKDALANNQPIPRMTEYIGECILLIVQKLAKKANFASYPFRDEMESDAIEGCCRYIHNFDVHRTTNAFSYVTQIASNSMIRRIQREKKELYKKALLTRGVKGHDHLQEASNSIIGTFENSLANKKAKVLASKVAA